MSTTDSATPALLQGILASLEALRTSQSELATTVQGINERINGPAGVNGVSDDALANSPTVAVPTSPASAGFTRRNDDALVSSPSAAVPASPSSSGFIHRKESSVDERRKPHGEASPPPRSGATKKITLTTYPGQAGVDPLPMNWGHPDPDVRGPVVVSRADGTFRRRNAIGAHGGSHGIYYALAVASKQLDAQHRPDWTNTQPAADIGPFPAWHDPGKIVALDPWGHVTPWRFSEVIARHPRLDVRPTIAITRAHMTIPELADSVRQGRLEVDGEVCVSAAGELAVTKFAVEPVWHLPGVAARFGIDEGTLRRALFESTGGSYPELITRGDLKLFLPPIGGLTVYCFGDPARMGDASRRLALRVHDECNGSDVFGSDICTCRPYLTFGIEEAVREAQRGGSGVVVYFRKEGRALGEVTKFLVYNARKRGVDRASEYFRHTADVAGVTDMRFQALMPDVLHWLGITKVDRLLSMSNMKYDAIVGQGIRVVERVPIPDDMIPADSRVEIDAKIHAGYCEFFPSAERAAYADRLQSPPARS